MLADAARTDPEAEVTQVSEVLEATLLAPPSKAPIQPQLGEIDLALLETRGPARVTFAEFAPLFDSEGVRFDLSGFGGTQQTFGYEASATALIGQFSFGIGGFLYGTDGFLPNNDLRNEIYTLQTKFQPVPELTLTAELGRTETEGGDRRLSLPPKAGRSEDLRIRSVKERARIGFHLRPHDSLSIVAYGEAASLVREASESNPLFRTNFDGDEDGVRVEASALTDLGSVDVQLGGEYAHLNVNTTTTVSPGFSDPEQQEGSAEVARAYGYVDVEFPAHFTWTLGAAFEHYEDEANSIPIAVSEWQPRVGVRIRPTAELEFRAAYTETLARRNIFSDTLDRTTLASFGQFFDETPGVEFRALSGAVDIRPAASVRAGVEARDFDIVFPESGRSGGVVDATEFGGYLSLTPLDTVSLSFEPSYETVRSPPQLLTIEDLDTLVLPITAEYFDPLGGFGSGTLSFFDQKGMEREEDFADSGFVFDMVLGYRFPRGRGVVTLEGLNLFDTEIELVERARTYSPSSFEEYLLITPAFAPERTVVLSFVNTF
jgi:hypothetical protein